GWLSPREVEGPADRLGKIGTGRGTGALPPRKNGRTPKVGREAATWVEYELDSAPFTGLPAQRFRPVLQDGLAKRLDSVTPVYGRSRCCFHPPEGSRQGAPARSPETGPCPTSRNQLPAVNGGPSPLRGNPRERESRKAGHQVNDAQLRRHRTAMTPLGR